MKKSTTYYRQLITPTALSSWASDILIAIPRIIAGGLLAFSFGSDKFGMPWTASGVELSLFEVAEWFPKDVAEFGGLFAMFPVTFAWLGAGSEAIGGLFLLAGLQTRLSSFLIACTMLVAIFFQKWGGPVWHMLPAMGFLWVAMTGIALGSGRIGLDYLLSRRWNRGNVKDTNNATAVHSATSAMPQMKGAVLAIALVLVGTAINAQTYGNRSLSTKTYPEQTTTAVLVNLNADITLDANAKGMVIEAESNIIDLIDIDYSGTSLELSQKKWIEPNLPIRITIGAGDLLELEHDTWGTTTVQNIDNEVLTVRANIGTVVLAGKTDNLILRSKKGKILATELVAQAADIRLKGAAVANLNVVEKAVCNLNDRSTLTYVNTPTETSDCTPQVYVPNVNAKYIDFKIKNNSWSRRHFVVVGPKPDGTEFSYGFPMMPGQSKKERWTTGTKIYRENALGVRTLLVTISAADENTTVKLFK